VKESLDYWTANGGEARPGVITSLEMVVDTRHDPAGLHLRISYRSHDGTAEGTLTIPYCRYARFVAESSFVHRWIASGVPCWLVLSEGYLQWTLLYESFMSVIETLRAMWCKAELDLKEKERG